MGVRVLGWDVTNSEACGTLQKRQSVKSMLGTHAGTPHEREGVEDAEGRGA